MAITRSMRRKGNLLQHPLGLPQKKRKRSTAPPRPSPLLLLPPELRNIIYELVLAETFISRVDLACQQPPISRVSKQLRNDVLPMLPRHISNKRWTVPLRWATDTHSTRPYRISCPPFSQHLASYPSMRPWILKLLAPCSVTTKKKIIFYVPKSLVLPERNLPRFWRRTFSEQPADVAAYVAAYRATPLPPKAPRRVVAGCDRGTGTVFEALQWLEGRLRRERDSAHEYDLAEVVEWEEQWHIRRLDGRES